MRVLIAYGDNQVVVLGTLVQCLADLLKQAKACQVPPSI